MEKSGWALGVKTVKTNNQWRELKSNYELPTRVLKEQFDYQSEEEQDWSSYFQYKGTWYCTDQFMRFGYPGTSTMGNWQGYSSDSFFSGVVVEFNDDNEVKLGTYFS